MAGCGLNLESAPWGAIVRSDGSVCWRVWAPNHKSLELVLFDERGNPSELPMERDPTGIFFREVFGVREGQQYGYRLPGGNVRPDPASRWQPNGVHRPSAVLNPGQFRWTDESWLGVPREKLVIYELHVGTFTAEGTFDAVATRLEALRELGITAIEVMPVAQFPGERGWGYDGVHPYAVQNSYGGPHEFASLVDACHRHGLAVILDVVYNHFGPEGNYFGEFGPYFTSSYPTPWGPAINFDGAGSEGVRAFVLDNVRYWVRDFHVDGLRLDAVHAIFDSSAPHILQEIKEAAASEAQARRWPVHVIAESNQNDVKLVDPPEKGGYGLDAVWSDDFHHSVHSLLTCEDRGYYVDFGRVDHLVKALNSTFVFDGCYSRHRGTRYGTPAGDRSGDRFVVSIQNHDQVGNRARGDRFGTLLAAEQQRLAAGLLMLSPYLPQLFMGEEYGEKHPFPFFCSFADADLVEAVRCGRREEFARFAWHEQVPDPQADSTFESAKLTWSWSGDSIRGGLRRLYHDLLSARQRWPALADYNNRVAETLNGSAPRTVVRLVRGATSSQDERALVVYFNLDKNHQPVHDVSAAGLKLLLSSENDRYSGRRTANDAVDVLLPYEFQVRGPSGWESP
ncbi:MAG: malto-oligosyltrehalose trehalohydrolase [Pirellulales bacterium]